MMPVETGNTPLSHLADHLIDRLAIGAIGNVDRDLDDILELRSGLLEQDLGAIHRVLGLRRGIADADDLAVEVHGGLAAQVDRVAGAHRHADVVVELLFRIGFARVEFAQGT